MSPEPWEDARGRLEAAALGYPIEWPNEPFSMPDLAPWLSVQAEGDMLEAIEMHQAGAWEERGVLGVHVLVPIGTGSLLARQIAKAIANIYRDASREGAATIYRRAAIGDGRPSEDGKWWVLTVTVDFVFTDRPA